MPASFYRAALLDPALARSIKDMPHHVCDALSQIRSEDQLARTLLSIRQIKSALRSGASMTRTARKWRVYKFSIMTGSTSSARSKPKMRL
jgi:hypothetical protein